MNGIFGRPGMQGISGGILIAVDGCRETAKAATSKAIGKLLLRGAMMRGEVEDLFAVCVLRCLRKPPTVKFIRWMCLDKIACIGLFGSQTNL
jgi:hypothetical protein